jgi:hypothetical protein
MNAPVNAKSLFHFICNQMEKLDKKEITVQDAQAQANLAKQVNNLLTYELKRADIQIKLDVHNFEFKKNLELRDIELKNFVDGK